MRSRSFPFISAVLILAFILSGCSFVPKLQDQDIPVDLPIGPQLSPAEQQAQVFDAMWTYISEYYVHYENAGVDWDALRETYLARIENGLTPDEFNALLDELETELPNGEIVHQTREEKIQSELVDTSTYGGIGAFVGFQAKEVPHIILLDVMPGSPAEKAGLQAHDSILAIDGNPVLLEEGMNAVNRVRGEPGTTVTLTVQTPGEEPRDVEITRSQLSGGGGTLKYEILPDTTIGYILFPPPATASLADDITQALAEFEKGSVTGLIIDLRIANDNSSWPLDAMLTLFQDGEAGEIYTRSKSQVLTVDGQDIAGSQTLPIAILVGENTSGLPEIFAAAMQVNQRAIIIGAETQGSFETLSGFTLPDGSLIFIAGTSYRISSVYDVGVSGIRPEVQQEAGWDQVTVDEDPVLQSAIETLEVK